MFWFDLELGTNFEDRVAAGLLESVVCTLPPEDGTFATGRDGSFANEPVEPPPGARGTKANVQVLVVEDNAVNLRVACGFLDRMGYAHQTAGNGEEALQRLVSGRFDLVLMDCQMPVMDGFEATRKIRAGEAGERNSRVPIVALTAATRESERQGVMDCGMDEYLAKPFSLSVLRELVERMLAKSIAS